VFVTSKTGLVLGMFLLLAACDRGPKQAPAIGEAFVGPHNLQIRADVTSQSKGLATLQHGERVAILQQRRRAVKVRTAKGAEGWVDERQLLSAQEMAELRDLAAAAKALPSQGKATSYSDLNVHTLPARQAPSFVQLKEGAAAEVLQSRLVPRTDSKRKPLLPPLPKIPKKVAAKKPAKEQKVPPPPMPKPPSPPRDWLEMSMRDLEDEDDAEPEAKPEQIAPPVPVERWSLIRVPGGAAGWVLSRLVVLAIPDEVAQYAEGKRIVAYMPLGQVEGEGKKHHWFWATSVQGPQDYDFDSFRVFIWNNRRGRYETSYIDRNVTGFLPVLPREIEWQSRKVPGFSLCVLNKEGQRIRREFAFVENRVRSAGERPCEAPPANAGQRVQGIQPTVPARPEAPPGVSGFERLRERVKSAFLGVFGR
jgi:hypothetical protein